MSCLSYNLAAIFVRAPHPGWGRQTFCAKCVHVECRQPVCSGTHALHTHCTLRPTPQKSVLPQGDVTIMIAAH